MVIEEEVDCVRLRKLRKESGLTGKEFANKIGCSASFVSDVENGRKQPSHKVLTSMAGALGVSRDDLRKKTDPLKDRIIEILEALPERGRAEALVALLKIAEEYQSA